MSLSVGDALRDGLGRTFERNGLLLIGVFVVIQLATAVGLDTLTRANLEYLRRQDALPGGAVAGVGDTSTPFAIGLGVTAALLVVFVVALLAEAARIVAVRTLVSDRTDTVPAGYVRRNIGMATLNGFVGGIVVFTLTLIGLVILIVPGVFIAVSFLFTRQEIAVRDVNFVDAMGGSWELAVGNRFELLLIGFVVLIAELVVVVIGAIVGAADPTAAALFSAVAGAVAAVFGIASLSRAYVQLREVDEGDADDGDAPDRSEEPDYEGALTADDLPPPDDGNP